MKLVTKFEIGQEVYVCKSNSAYEMENCKTCDGIGKVNIKGKIYRCPECNGAKFTPTKFIKIYAPEKRIIRKIKISVYETNRDTGINIRYETRIHANKNESIEDCRNIIFATLEEAETRCKELSGEVLGE